MKTYTRITWQESENPSIYCTNIVYGEEANIKNHYFNKKIIDITKIPKEEIELAKKKGMPIIYI